MNPPSITRDEQHRVPVAIISHAVWLYFRFGLSYRDVEELLVAPGVTVTYEAIRQMRISSITAEMTGKSYRFLPADRLDRQQVDKAKVTPRPS